MVVFPSHWKKALNTFFFFPPFLRKVSEVPSDYEIWSLLVPSPEVGMAFLPSQQVSYCASYTKINPPQKKLCSVHLDQFPSSCLSPLWPLIRWWLCVFVLVPLFTFVLKKARKKEKGRNEKEERERMRGKEIKVSSLFWDKYPHFQIWPCQMKRFPMAL